MNQRDSLLRAYTNLCGYRSYLNKLEPHTLQEFYNYK